MDTNWSMKEANRRARIAVTRDAIQKLQDVSGSDEGTIALWAGFVNTSIAARVADGWDVNDLFTALDLPTA